MAGENALVRIEVIKDEAAILALELSVQACWLKADGRRHAGDTDLQALAQQAPVINCGNGGRVLSTGYTIWSELTVWYYLDTISNGISQRASI